MKRFFNVFLILAIVALSSCNNAVKQKQLAKIDSLSVILDSANVQLTKINLDTIKNIFAKFEETNEKASEHYQKYRTEENWKFVCAYQQVKKPIKEMIEKYQSFSEDLNTSKKQLDDLRHDVNKNLINEKDFASYFNMEVKSAGDLSIRIKMKTGNALKQMKNFDTIHPYMLKLIDSYSENKTKK